MACVPSLWPAARQTCPGFRVSSPPGANGRSPVASRASPAPPEPSAAAGCRRSLAAGADPDPSTLTHTHLLQYRY